jgi:hypothetical protein
MVAAAAENGYTSEARGITADARSWGTTRTKARDCADQHDPAKIALRTAQLNFTPKLLTDAFDKFFTAKCAGGTGEKSIANLTTPRNQLRGVREPTQCEASREDCVRARDYARVPDRLDGEPGKTERITRRGRSRRTLMHFLGTV